MGFRGQTALTGFGSASSDDHKADSPGTYYERLIGGRIRILHSLNSVLTGWAYMARVEATGEEVAVRIFEPEAHDDESTAVFMAEAASVARLSGPHTVALLDFGEEDDGRVFLATEPITGRTLSEHVRREGPISSELALRVADQVLDSLAQAHEIGVLHGELNCENIALTDWTPPDFYVKVIDMGVARMLGGALHVSRVMERPLPALPYMSPEQLLGRDYDVRTDLYALAVVMFEMLTGRLPVTGTSADDLKIKKIRDMPLTLEQARPGVEFPPGASDFLLGALSARRENRPSDCQDFRRRMHRAFGLAGAAVNRTEKTSDPRLASVRRPTEQVRVHAHPSVRPVSGDSPPSAPKPVTPAKIKASVGGGDRRRSRRVSKLITAICRCDDREIKVTVADISETGGFINSAHISETGRKVVLSFRNPVTGMFDIKVLAEIARTTQVSGGPGQLPGFGVKWLKLRAPGAWSDTVSFAARMFGLKLPESLPADVDPTSWEYVFVTGEVVAVVRQ